MIIISSVTGIETYVANYHPDFQGADAERLVQRIQAERPEWGTDWSEWLAENIEAFRAGAAAPPRVIAVEIRADETAVVTHWRPNEETCTTFVRPDGSMHDAGERGTRLDASDQGHIRAAVARARHFPQYR